MTQDDPTASNGRGSDKARTLNLDDLIGPWDSVRTDVGTVYLYDLRTSDLEAISKISGASPDARFRGFLPNIASLEAQRSFKQERKPLSHEEVDSLSSGDLKVIAERYVQLMTRRAAALDNERVLPERTADDSALTYLERLLLDEAQTQSESMRRMYKSVLESNNSIFSEVRKHTSALGSTLGAFDRLATRMSTSDTLGSSYDSSTAISATFARQSQERAEELEMVKLTGRMTAESAATLKSLAEAATVLLEQMEERDRKAERATGQQIRVAVWSVFVAALLSLAALIVALLSYRQDKLNIAKDNSWQEEVASHVVNTRSDVKRNLTELHLIKSRLTQLEQANQKPSSASGPLVTAPQKKQ